MAGKWTTRQSSQGFVKEIYSFYTCSFIVINVDSFQLKVGIAMVCTSWIDAMLVRDNFPELQQKWTALENAKLERLGGLTSKIPQSKNHSL